MRTLKFMWIFLVVILLTSCEFTPADTGAVAKSDLRRNPLRMSLRLTWRLSRRATRRSPLIFITR